MFKEIHHLPDGRLKVGDHFITDEVAIDLINKYNRLFKETFLPDFPWRAIVVINEVLKIGSQKYKPGAWRQESIQHHLNKALGHLHNYLDEIHINEDGEDSLAHTLTRLAMAVSVRETSQ